MCWFLDAGMPTLSARSCGRGPKSAKARSRGKYGTRQCSECYGDRILVAISMVDRITVPACQMILAVLDHALHADNT
jgi:hypothetical protein